MDRRHLIKGIFATTMLHGAARGAIARPRSARNIIVVGAGIIGAAIAYELSKRGARVTVLDRTGPASGTTGVSYAYLNSSTKSTSQSYYTLNWLGMAGWHEWEHEAGQPLPLRWGGAVYWRDGKAEATKLQETLETVRRWGYSGEDLDAAGVRRLLPTVTSGSVSTGAFFPEEGAVDPKRAVTALLARATTLGAKVIYPSDVSEVIVKDGKVRGVRTPGGEIFADTVVLAAGLGNPGLLETYGINLPLKPSVGILLHSRPYRPVIDRLSFAPRATFRQMTNGSILASIGHEGASVDGTKSTDEIAHDILRETSTYLPQIKGIPIDKVTIGQRIVPADSFPVVGYASKLSGLYIVSTHSGITMSPIIGRSVATEILDGVDVALFDPFRPQRFS